MIDIKKQALGIAGNPYFIDFLSVSFQSN